MSSYLCPEKESTAEFKDRGSRFIAYVKQVITKEEAEAFIETLWKEHPKARHVCYAYRLETDPEVYRANDDGEPNGSAGLPILNQIRSAELAFTAVGVVRYFGGTLLGVSGLINAYKTAAAEAIVLAGTQPFRKQMRLTIEFDYAEMETVMSFVKNSNYEVEERLYEKFCKFILRIPEDEFQTFKSYIGPHQIQLV